MMVHDLAASLGAAPARRDMQTLTVPWNNRSLVSTPPERVRNFRKHLVRTLRALGMATQPRQDPSPLRPEPAGFAGTVARTACTLCAGFCCRDGGDHAYLDGRDLARVRQLRPGLPSRELTRLFVDNVPAESYAGSCIFHGPRGCTLDRTLRSDVCNRYFCHELREFVTTRTGAAKVVVVGVDENGTTRQSPPVMSWQAA
jgi:hypothetical protein